MRVYVKWRQRLCRHCETSQSIAVSKPVNEKLEALKSTVSELFGEPESPFKIVESKSAIKNFTKQHTIDGKQGIDAATFLNTVRPLVVNLLEINRNTKFQLSTDGKQLAAQSCLEVRDQYREV